MSIDPKLMQQAQKIFQGLETRIQTYFSELGSKKNGLYLKNFEGYQIHPPEPGQVTIQLPVKNEFVDVPIEYKLSTSATVKLTNLHCKEIYIMINIPPILFGPRNLMPQIVFICPSPIAYPGNIGLVWEPLTNSAGKYAFHPYTSPDTMREDLIQYFGEGVVDQFCDILNRWELDECKKIREFTTDLTRGKYGESFKRPTGKNQPPASILFPITYEHEADVRKSTIQVKTWAGSAEWIPPAEIVIKVMDPFSAIATMFNEAGDLDKDVPIGLSLEVQEQLTQKDRRNISMRDKEKELRIGSDAELFGANYKQKKRDEFGYVMGEEIGKRDTAASRQSVLDQKARIETSLKTAASAPTQTTRQVKKYNSATDWFEECQGKKYTAKGDTSTLSFLEKTNVNIVLGLNQPFILRYARDQVRLKLNSTSAKAIELLFTVYNKGFLYEV
jgi:hypothetical protein